MVSTIVGSGQAAACACVISVCLAHNGFFGNPPAGAVQG
jgi:hypothetical protein